MIVKTEDATGSQLRKNRAVIDWFRSLLNCLAQKGRHHRTGGNRSIPCRFLPAWVVARHTHNEYEIDQSGLPESCFEALAIAFDEHLPVVRSVDEMRNEALLNVTNDR